MILRIFIFALLPAFFNSIRAAGTTSNLNIKITVQSVGNNTNLKQSGFVAGKTGKLSLKITGKYDDGALAGLHPAAWIRPSLNNRSSCKDAVRNYLQVGPNSSQDIDLNSYNFITLNRDNSIGFMDPRLNLATANLIALKKMDEEVTAWYLNSARGELFVTQPRSKKIGIINALNGKLIDEIFLPGIPQKMVADKKQSMLWVTVKQKLLAIDINSRQIESTIAIKSGNVLVTLSEQEEVIWIYNPGNGELVAVDAVSQKIKWKRQLSERLNSMAYAYHADRLYLSDAGNKEILFLFPTAESRIESLKLTVTPEKLVTSPDGLWLFALDFKQRQLSVIESAVNRSRHHLLFKNEYDQVIFSEHYAYVHHTNSPKASLIQLDTLAGMGSPSVIEVPFGVNSPGKQSGDFEAIIPFPEGGAVVTSNASDKTLFIYLEDGMLAPSNAFKVYTASPKALLIHDKTLTETRPGLYEAVTIIPHPGNYEVVFYLDSPLVVSCFPLTVAGAGEDVKSKFQSPVSEIQLLSGEFKSGRPSEVKIKLKTDYPVKEATLNLLFLKPGSNWQKRVSVEPNETMEYSASITFPEPGKFLLAVESEKLKLNFDQEMIKTIEVKQ